MPGRRRPDGIAGELAAVEAQYQAKLERAEVEYQLARETWNFYASGRLSYMPLGEEEAAWKRDIAVRKAEEEYARAVERIEWRVRAGRLAVALLDDDDDGEKGEHLQPERAERGPYADDVLERAVRLRQERKSHDDMHEAIAGLSKRQARYIANAVDAGVLRYTRYGLEGVTRTDGSGSYIPKL